MYEAFKGRVGFSGNDHREGFRNSTKRQVYNYIKNSPTRSFVEVYELEKGLDDKLHVEFKVEKESIVSDKTGKTFHERTVLFLPDEDEAIGSYIKYDKKFYLTTNISDVDGYPQSFLEHCKYMLDVKYGETIRIQDGTDDRGKPIWVYITPKVKLPVVYTSKIYAVLDNSQLPLPEGAVLIKMPYHEDLKIEVNDVFTIHGDEIKITTVSTDDLYFDDDGKIFGYYTVRGQRGVADGK